MDPTVRLGKQAAQAIDRRRFLRKVAAATFAGVATVMTGHLPALADDDLVCMGTIGTGCPGSTYGNPCGPSPCCIASGRSTACKCATGTTCKNTANCLGKDAHTWGTTDNCWTCITGWKYWGPNCSVKYTTTCCDCKTSGCGDPSSRCIGYSISYQFSGSGCPQAPGELASLKSGSS